MAAEPQTGPLPVPDDFKFQWDSPEEAMAFWTVDLMHWPNGISPLCATMDMPAFGRGLVTAANELAMPFSDMRFKVINHFVYSTSVPYSTDPVKMGERMMQMQQRMLKHAPGLLDRWRTVYEPEVRSINEDTLFADYSKVGDSDLAALIEQLVAKREREGELHFLAVFPAMGAVMPFEVMYTRLFGVPKAGEHLQLLQGFDNKSTEGNNGVWRLAMEARKRPQVLEAIRKTDPALVHEALKDAEGGPAFRDAVDEWTAVYGWRAAELDIAYKTWREDPAPVYMLIREFAARDDYDPEEEMKSLVAARQAREKLLLSKISGEELAQFEGMLRAAQQYLPVQEDHNFWIDQQGSCVERVPVLEAGRRLVAAGRLDQPDDVFYLEYDELVDGLRGGKGDLRELSNARRASLARFRDMEPPAALGTPLPPEAMAEMENSPFAKFWGSPPAKHPDPRVINGNGASQGKVTGTARVIKSLDDAHRLRSGEILVCQATMPPWTPLFGIASGVVTDHGGILSHTAIVAREYQIPAVVGTKVGTALIGDGSIITVDGTNGTVTME